jgi:putative redox protein
MTMKNVSTRWAGGLRFVHTSGSGHALVTDAPEAAGGEDTAPSPVELVLHALIACAGVDVVTILRRMKEPLESLEVAAEAERAAEAPRVYTTIRMHFSVGGNVDPRKVERAIALSETKYCSVAAMLRPGVALASSWEIVTPDRPTN